MKRDAECAVRELFLEILHGARGHARNVRSNCRIQPPVDAAFNLQLDHVEGVCNALIKIWRKNSKIEKISKKNSKKSKYLHFEDFRRQSIAMTEWSNRRGRLIYFAFLKAPLNSLKQLVLVRLLVAEFKSPSASTTAGIVWAIDFWTTWDEISFSSWNTSFTWVR